jgi:hypothetical protein
MATTKKSTKRSMSAEHKAALAEGRAQGRAIRAYLEALEGTKPKRGRKRTSESMRKKIDQLSVRIAEADPLKRVQLIQDRMDLQADLKASEVKVDMKALEQDFVSFAASYSERKGLSYAAWRELGVPSSTLIAAGITRGS